jgi:uncharacterized membrane protein
MGPFLILIIGFVLIIVINTFLLNKRFSLSFIGRLAMAIMLVFTGIAHFTNTAVMEEMIPRVLPYKTTLVYLSGLFEILAAIGLVIRKISKKTSLALILFFLAVLPANIVGSINRVALGGMERGADYLYFRIPLQLFFIARVYYFVIRRLVFRNSQGVFNFLIHVYPLYF